MSALHAHLASGVTTVCRAWIVRRGDGATFGFTDHDGSLEIEGVICRASSGLTGGALATSTGLSVDNADASGALSDETITEADIRAGRWDGAAVVAWRVNWAAPEEREVLFRATLGEIAWGDGAFTAELRGAAEGLNKVRGRIYQKRCDASLGDARCRAALGPAHVAEMTVIGATENRVLALDEPAGFAPGWFAKGQVTVLTGLAAGLSGKVKADRYIGGRREVALWTGLRLDVRAGDRVRVEAGCDKRMETCRAKFGNLVNFRGFPHIPGEEWLMAYPTRGSRNDGGRL